MKRTVIKVVGESGMGLLSVGRIVSKALKDMGYWVNSDREYPSLIKGGHSSVQIDFGTKPLRALKSKADVVVALDLPGLMAYMDSTKKGGIFIHGFERHEQMPEIEEKAKELGIQVLYLPARELAYAEGGNEIMVNMVLLGLLWKVLGFDFEDLKKEVSKRFAKRPKILEIDLKCLEAGYNPKELENVPQLELEKPKSQPDTLLLDGNMALALGAIHAGVRAYYAYPMSPSSSILTYMANMAKESKVLVKQAEDEITAAQLAVGSMFMGTRALVGTSGGGFDLMTETFSLAGMIECPLVVIICQRPGPATGLPTWTGQGDLAMAIHSGHGEYGRMVIAVSDPTSSFELIQHALNYAEEFQVPVVLLSEKVISETLAMVPVFKQKTIPIKRGLVTNKGELAKLESSDRYRITESGVSRRWIPGSAAVGYYGNSDEHRENGALTEDEGPAGDMLAKRVRKLEAIKKVLPEPEVYGAKSKADLSFVGWGSSKCTMLDVIEELKEEGISVNYLHYEYLWPLKTKRLEQFFKENENVHILEGNIMGQLANLIEEKTDLKFKKRFLKYNGRPFFVDEVIKYVLKHKST